MLRQNVVRTRERCRIATPIRWRIEMLSIPESHSLCPIIPLGCFKLWLISTFNLSLPWDEKNYEHRFQPQVFDELLHAWHNFKTIVLIQDFLGLTYLGFESKYVCQKLVWTLKASTNGTKFWVFCIRPIPDIDIFAYIFRDLFAADQEIGSLPERKENRFAVIQPGQLVALLT